MRFYRIAFWTLTIFLTGGLTAQASENATSEGSIPEIATQDSSVVTPTVAAREIEPIARPEISEEQQSLTTAAIDSEQEARQEPSPSTENLATNREKEEALADATSQTRLAEIPQTEALQSDESVAELATPNSAALASVESPNANVGATEESAAISKAEALRPNQPIAQSSTANTNQPIADVQPEAGATCLAQATGTSASDRLAQASPRRCPRPQPVAPLALPEPVEEFGASPALSIYIPVGYGADRGTLFVSGSYQASTREDDDAVGAAGVGLGLGNAETGVGLELSYALETTDDSFGEGGFNAKLHRRLGRDASAALGWNGFLNIGNNDFEQSKYGVITKVFRTQESLNNAFSRVAVTVGVGDGQFRSNGAVEDRDNNVNVFGNVAIRVARPVSFITEWTGQDLALGLSIAPFKNIPFVITPAVRDVVGAGDEPRFVLGAGTAIRF